MISALLRDHAKIMKDQRMPDALLDGLRKDFICGNKVSRFQGLDPHRELPGPQNRPLPLVDFGVQPIRELF